MNSETDKAENELESELRERYRSIQAPPHLAARIRARVSDRQPVSRRWLPACVALPVVIAVVAILSIDISRKSPALTSPPRPSLAALSRLAPSKPVNVSPSLSHIKTVPRPSMPKKPALRWGKNPHTYREFNPLHKFEENDYEYV